MEPELIFLIVVLFALLLIWAGCALVVGLTLVVAWYESANARPELVACRFQRDRWWPALKTALRETVVLCGLVPLWPFGFLPRCERRVKADQVPVILLHGLFQNQVCWWWFRRQLEGAGHRVLSLNLSPWHNVEALTEILEKKIDRLRHRDGIRQVVLVGHSMGGMIARNYIQRRGGNDKVLSCILLGTPNHGSKLAPFALTPLGLLLLPGSPFLTGLNGAPLSADCPVTSIYSRHDTIVLPSDSSRLPEARNLELEGLGHASLLFSERVVRLVLQQLSGEVQCNPSKLSPANVSK